MVGFRRNWDNVSLLIYDLWLTWYLIKNVSFSWICLPVRRSCVEKVFSNDDNYEHVFSGETMQFCECWGLILFGETLDGKLLLLLLSNFSGNSIMLFGVRTMRFCFFGQNVGSNFFGGKFCFPPKFFVLRYWLNMWKMLLGRLLFLKERERETLIWLSFLEVGHICYILCCHDFLQSPKNGAENFFFRGSLISRFGGFKRLRRLLWVLPSAAWRFSHLLTAYRLRKNSEISTGKPPIIWFFFSRERFFRLKNN